MIQLYMRSKWLMQILVLFCFTALVSCEKSDEGSPTDLKAELEGEARAAKTRVHYGPATAVGAGTARVWVQTVQGKPVALGVEMTEGALENLPMHGMPLELSLKLPGQAHATGIKSIWVGWNPMGHAPDNVYTIPHFDFHFYMQTEGQIKQIEGGIDEGAYALLERGVMPPNHTFGPVPFAVPHMGVHWLDLNSPEFGPAGFSRTFIYGSHQDRVTFLEPMITLAYLQGLVAGDAEEIPVPALRIHENPGYYPQTYTISHGTNGTYSIALTDLVFRNRNK